MDLSIFWYTLVRHSSLMNLLKLFRIWLRIRRDIHKKNRLPAVADAESRLKNFLQKTLRIGDAGSRRLRASPIRRVVDSAHCRSAELWTPCISDPQSRRLPASPIRRVVNSAHRRSAESFCNNNKNDRKQLRSDFLSIPIYNKHYSRLEFFRKT